MQLRFNQLNSQLNRQLAPIYLLCGDEPYQLGEAARLVRKKAHKQGFTEREVLDVDSHFDWNLLAAAAEAMSLFATRKLIELRVNQGKLGKEGGAAIRAYCERPCADNLLLILAPELESKDLQTQWVKAVDALGAVVQVWPLKEKELEPWMNQRLETAGFQPEAGVAALLAERAEGNLLAAVQEVEKLRLLHAPGALKLDDLLGNLADSARFDVYALMTAAIAGDRARVQRVLFGLRDEGTSEVLVLWVLARDVRMLAEAAGALARRESLETVLTTHRVSRQRQDGIVKALQKLSPNHLQRMLQRCLHIDLVIKGRAIGDPWLELARLADALTTAVARRTR
ncbi:DNA polymerase III subunit delta [Chromatium weissei]|nr:DNA polymerase III subunit delta [Chromatium weissei]